MSPAESETLITFYYYVNSLKDVQKVVQNTIVVSGPGIALHKLTSKRFHMSNE